MDDEFLGRNSRFNQNAVVQPLLTGTNIYYLTFLDLIFYTQKRNENNYCRYLCLYSKYYVSLYWKFAINYYTECFVIIINNSFNVC